MTVLEFSEWLNRILLVVLSISTLAIYFLLPARNGEFTRAFRLMFGAFALLLIQFLLRRLHFYVDILNWPEDWAKMATNIILLMAIIAAPRAAFSAYEARRNYRSSTASALARQAAESAKDASEYARRAGDIIEEHHIIHDDEVVKADAQ